VFDHKLSTGSCAGAGKLLSRAFSLKMKLWRAHRLHNERPGDHLGDFTSLSGVQNASGATLVTLLEAHVQVCRQENSSASQSRCSHCGSAPTRSQRLEQRL
jgi:hypothetical protein